MSRPEAVSSFGLERPAEISAGLSLFGSPGFATFLADHLVERARRRRSRERSFSASAISAAGTFHMSTSVKFMGIKYAATTPSLAASRR
jgi:hypothetical protein